MKKIVPTSSLILSLILLVLGCDPDDATTTSEKSGPSITSFGPTSGPVGTEIFITGKNFSTTAANNTVKIGSIAATVTSATTTEIFITVPSGATSGAISVTVGDKTDTGGIFTVTESTTPTSIALDMVSLAIYTNDTAALVATVTGDDSNNTIAWSSNNEEVLEVDSNGNITALQAGTAEVTASVGNVMASATITINPNIYVVGFEWDGNTNVAKLWTNGEHENLANGIVANSVFVHGMDVYVAGQATNDRAVVWKNGIETYLTDGSGYAEAQSVFVVQADVYVVGHEQIGDVDVVKVWKNGALLYDLTNGVNTARAYSIFVVGTDVYVAGYERNNAQKSVAKIWKNEIPTALTDGTNDSEANSIYVLDSNIYVAGAEENGGNSYAKVWKNEEAINLTNGLSYANAYSIFVKETDFYVAGAEHYFNQNTYFASFWENEVQTNLTNGQTLANSYSVYVLGSDIYVCGFEEEQNEGKIVKVWKNEVPIYNLTSESLANAYSIFVK